MDFHSVMECVSKIVDSLGVAVIVIGLVVSSILFLWAEFRQWWGTDVSEKRLDHPFQSYRQSLGRSILIGLEFLIAGDIIRTVAVSPTFYNLGTLATLVMIRSFLSWGLSMEIEGRWPWQQATRSKQQVASSDKVTAGD